MSPQKRRCLFPPSSSRPPPSPSPVGRSSKRARPLSARRHQRHPSRGRHRRWHRRRSETGGVGVYTLGQLDMIGGSTITNEAMWTFNKNSLDQAVDILPGVTVHQLGRLAQRRRHLRARLQPLPGAALHGRRPHLPAGRQPPRHQPLPDAGPRRGAGRKGLRVRAQGPGGKGGAINLVSRKPTKENESRPRRRRVRRRSWLDGPVELYAYAGTRQKGYYAQVSGTMVDRITSTCRTTSPRRPGD